MRKLMVENEGQNVGKATIERQGMFYLVICTVAFDGRHLPEIIIHSKLGSINLGRCIPNGTEAVLVKRIAVKEWDSQTGEITASYSVSEEYESVEDGRPFVRLNSLSIAKYCPKEKKIVFK